MGGIEQRGQKSGGVQRGGSGWGARELGEETKLVQVLWADCDDVLCLFKRSVTGVMDQSRGPRPKSSRVDQCFRHGETKIGMTIDFSLAAPNVLTETAPRIASESSPGAAAGYVGVPLGALMFWFYLPALTIT